MKLSKQASAWLVGISILLLAALLTFALMQRFWSPGYEFHGGTFDPPRAAAQLVMTDQRGNEFNLEDHRGKVVLVYFGYTFCPDFCPTTMLEIQDVLAVLGEDAQHVEVAFVSVDPNRDTPERLKEYMSFYDPGFYGLSTSEEHTEQVKRDWGVMGTAREAAEGQDYYLVDHTTSLFAIAPDGNIGAVWPYGMDYELIAEDIEHLIND